MISEDNKLLNERHDFEICDHFANDCGAEIMANEITKKHLALEAPQGNNLNEIWYQKVAILVE